jgi:hypothetical protein
VPDVLDRLSAADIDEVSEGRAEERNVLATLIAWQTHQLLGSQADESWLQKFGSFRDFVAFFKPPFVITEGDET